MFDQALIEEALTLSIIGLSTAFSLLFFLSISIWIVGKLFADKSDQVPEGEVSQEERNKALAASIAVATLVEIRENSALLPTPVPR